MTKLIATTLQCHHCHGFEHAYNEQKLDLVLVLVLESKGPYDYDKTYSCIRAGYNYLSVQLLLDLLWVYKLFKVFHRCL